MVLQKLQLLSVACPLCRLDVRETFSAEAGCAWEPAAAPRFAFGGDRPVLQREGELSGNTLVSSDIFRRLAGCLV